MSPGEENYLDSGKICRKYCRHLASIFPNGGHGSAKRTVFIAVGSNQQRSSTDANDCFRREIEKKSVVKVCKKLLEKIVVDCMAVWNWDFILSYLHRGPSQSIIFFISLFYSFVFTKNFANASNTLNKHLFHCHISVSLFYFNLSFPVLLLLSPSLLLFLSLITDFLFSLTSD